MWSKGGPICCRGPTVVQNSGRSEGQRGQKIHAERHQMPCAGQLWIKIQAGRSSNGRLPNEQPEFVVSLRSVGNRGRMCLRMRRDSSELRERCRHQLHDSLSLAARCRRHPLSSKTAGFDQSLMSGEKKCAHHDSCTDKNLNF